MENRFYALEATIENGKKLLCWQQKKHFYFAEKSRGFASPYPPTLFRTRKEAYNALKNIPSKGANLKQFENVLKARKTKVVKVLITH